MANLIHEFLAKFKKEKKETNVKKEEEIKEDDSLISSMSFPMVRQFRPVSLGNSLTPVKPMSHPPVNSRYKITTVDSFIDPSSWEFSKDAISRIKKSNELFDSEKQGEWDYSKKDKDDVAEKVLDIITYLVKAFPNQEYYSFAGSFALFLQDLLPKREIGDLDLEIYKDEKGTYPLFEHLLKLTSSSSTNPIKYIGKTSEKYTSGTRVEKFEVAGIKLDLFLFEGTKQEQLQKENIITRNWYDINFHMNSGSYILKEKYKMVEYLLAHKGIPDREKKIGKHLRDIKFAGNKFGNSSISNFPITLIITIHRTDEEDSIHIINSFI